MKKVVFIDYENVQNISLSKLENKELEVKIFVGNSQNKIPFSLVNEAQGLGKSLEWIKIEGQGNNALDFHISYYLGVFSARKEYDEYIILSKDKGFDPLIRFLNSIHFKCRRINSIIEIEETRKAVPEIRNDNLDKVLENLKKIPKHNRPRKRSTLKKHIRTIFNNKLDDREIDSMIDYLFIKELVSEMNQNLTFNL
jgi:hypothetical protein